MINYFAEPNRKIAQLKRDLAMYQAFYESWQEFHCLCNGKADRDVLEGAAQTMLEMANAIQSARQ